MAKRMDWARAFKPVASDARPSRAATEATERRALVASKPLRPSDVPVSRSTDAIERDAEAFADRILPRPRGQSALESPVETAPAAVWEAIDEPGRPLVGRERLSELGDLSSVRVHTGGKASESARILAADAYAVGHDIVLGEGYAPDEPSGRRLIAHELEHVNQRRLGGSLIVARQPQAKIGRPTASTDTAAADRKGRELAERIKSGKWGSADAEKLAHDLEFFEGTARARFRAAIREALGEELKEYEGAERWLPEQAAAVTQQRLVVPISKQAPRALSGFRVQYSAQIFDETTEGTTVEVYTDTSAYADVSISVPLAKVATFKIGATERKGTKESEKHETKHGGRTGRTISRTFKVQRVERDVFTYDEEKTYFGVTEPTGYGLPAPQIAHRVTYEQRGYNPTDKQRGYQIVPEEGGEVIGPFWAPFERGTWDEHAGLFECWDWLRREQEQIAQEAAKW